MPLFTTDPEALLAARYALVIVSLSYPLLYVSMLVSAACNGMGNTVPALVISLGRLLVLFVPLTLALAAGLGLIGIFVAMAVSNLAVGLGSMSYMRRARQRHDDETPVRA